MSTKDVAPNVQLTPSAAVNGPLDLATKEGMAIWTAAVAGIYGKEDTNQFDLSKDRLRLFIADVERHCTMYGMEECLTMEYGTSDYYLPEQHGSLPMEDVTYYVERMEKNTREYQASVMLGMCLMNSISGTARSRVILKKKSYTFDRKIHGAALLKVIIATADVDNPGTVMAIRTKISALPDALVKMDFNVTNFNDMVASLVEDLATRGHTADDILLHLFQSYHKCPNSDFHDYVSGLKNRYTDGELDLTVETLMLRAKNWYETSVADNSWTSLTEDQKQIVALQSELEKEKKAKQAAHKKSKKKKKSDKKKAAKAKKDDRNAPWTYVPSSDGSKIKDVGGKIFHWCDRHKQWQGHTTEACQGIGIKTDTPQPTSKPSPAFKSAVAAMAQME